MKKTIFLKSTLRQPLRSLFILLLVGVISFAFVARVGETLLISQEQEQLIQYYRSIGIPVYVQGSGKFFNLDDVIDYLEQAPYIVYADRRQYTSGVIQDGYYNANNSPSSGWWLTYDPESYTIHPKTVYFYGIYTGKEITGDVKPTGRYPFTVDEVITGYSEYISPDKSVLLHVNPEEFGERYTMLKYGERYLLSASLYTWACTDAGMSSPSLTNPSAFAWISLGRTIGWFLPASENVDLSLPENAALANLIQQCHDNSCAIHITATADMSAMPAVLSSDDTGNRYYLVDGRWLDHKDDLAGNRAIVIHQGLATARDLAVGDTITLKLRDIRYKSDNGRYYTPPNGYLSDVPAPGQNIRSQTETFEIVGIYSNRIVDGGHSMGSTEYQLAYIPLSVYPKHFSLTKTEVYGPSYNFVLDTPAHEEAFMEAVQDDLENMGYTISFRETGYHNFKTATEGIGTAAKSNVIIFAIILAVCFCLAVFVYFRFRRKDLAISRALGVPVGRCVISSVLPLTLVGGAGIVAGSALAWSYTQGNAETLLSALVEAAKAEGATATLPTSTLTILCLVLIAALLVLSLIFATLTVKRPVLSQLQGGGNRK